MQQQLVIAIPRSQNPNIFTNHKSWEWWRPNPGILELQKLLKIPFPLSFMTE